MGIKLQSISNTIIQIKPDIKRLKTCFFHVETFESFAHSTQNRKLNN